MISPISPISTDTNNDIIVFLQGSNEGNNFPRMSGILVYFDSPQGRPQKYWCRCRFGIGAKHDNLFSVLR